MTSLADAKAACARQAALEQRARLLRAIWADLHSERRVAERGTLPTRLLSRLVSVNAPLQNYAADLIFCPDGMWRVMRDDIGQHPAASVLEAPVLAVFLPRLCRLLLGQSLLLPSIPVWWLGDPETGQALAKDCRRFWLRDGFDGVDRPVGLAKLSAACRVRLQALVDADPARFIAGLQLAPSGPIRRVICDTVRAGFD